MATNKYDVIIIGAGCAGLKAAETLFTNGIKNILLLEALDRLGGRLHTIWFNDDPKLPIELGGNWIHGLKGNPLYEITEQHKELFYHEKEMLWGEKRIYCADLKGQTYEEETAVKMMTFFDNLVEESRTFWRNKKECNFNSFEDFINYRLEEYIKNDPEEVKQLKRAMIRQQSKVLCFEIGCDNLTESSIKEYGSYDRFDDTNYEFPGGFTKLILHLANKLPADSIKLNHAVNSISLENNSDLMVECNNGSIFKTNHVIVTSSLNYLKNNYKTLLPNSLLNESKLIALENLSMGYVNKLILIYDDMSFYPQYADSLHVLHLDNDYNDPNYDIKKEWFKKIAKFDRFFKNILRALITGKEAIYIESLSESEIATILTEFLRKVLKNDKIPLPNRLIRTTWCTNPYILGSYTFVSQNSISTKHFNDLAEPLYHNNTPKILFAGEATHENYYSTAHAAYLSGQREAKRLIHLNKTN